MNRDKEKKKKNVEIPASNNNERQARFVTSTHRNRTSARCIDAQYTNYHISIKKRITILPCKNGYSAQQGGKVVANRFDRECLWMSLC